MEQRFGSEITRAIWGDPENVLLIYAGAAAEFALNPENHWLFYTGKLPADPLKRFQDTLHYQQKLFFMPAAHVPLVARHIKDMHRQVEKKRSDEQGSMKISDSAFLQVFSMLIEYGILGYEYLHRRRMALGEKEKYFNDIHAIAILMEVGDFPEDYHHYLTRRTQMVVRELQFNAYTRELLEAYRKNLGPLRYGCLLQFQALFVDPILVQRLGLKANGFFRLAFWLYPRLRWKPVFLSLLPRLLKNEVRPHLKQFA